MRNNIFYVFLLRTNLPVKIMNFPDYMTMEGQSRSCVGHQEILDYLKSYMQHFQIHQYIQVLKTT